MKTRSGQNNITLKTAIEKVQNSLGARTETETTNEDDSSVSSTSVVSVSSTDHSQKGTIHKIESRKGKET